MIIRHTRKFHSDKAPACDAPSIRSVPLIDSWANQDFVTIESGWSTTTGHRPPQQSSEYLETLECLGGDDFDLESPLVDWNELMSLPNSILPVEDVPTASGSFQSSDLCLSRTFEALPSATSHPVSLHGQPSGVPSVKNVSSSNVSHLPVVGSSKRRDSFIPDSDEYEQAKDNYEKMSTTSSLQRLRFPTRFAIARFVVAFFEYMAPQLPVVHQPTFRISSAPCESLAFFLACRGLLSLLATKPLFCWR